MPLLSLWLISLSKTLFPFLSRTCSPQNWEISKKIGDRNWAGLCRALSCPQLLVWSSLSSKGQIQKQSQTLHDLRREYEIKGKQPSKKSIDSLNKSWVIKQVTELPIPPPQIHITIWCTSLSSSAGTETPTQAEDGDHMLTTSTQTTDWLEPENWWLRFPKHHPVTAPPTN